VEQVVVATMRMCAAVDMWFVQAGRPAGRLAVVHAGGVSVRHGPGLCQPACNPSWGLPSCIDCRQVAKVHGTPAAACPLHCRVEGRGSDAARLLTAPLQLQSRA
jgi:hypothetical protein